MSVSRVSGSAPQPQVQGTKQEGSPTAATISKHATIAGAPADKFEKLASKRFDKLSAKTFQAKQKAQQLWRSTRGAKYSKILQNRAAKATKAFVKMRKAAGFAGKLFKFAKGVGNFLGVTGAVATAVDQYKSSTARSKAGKVIDAAGAGIMSFVFGKKNPIVAAGDALTGGRLSTTLNGAVRAATTLGEGVASAVRSGAKNVDTRGIEKFHADAAKGKYGPVFKAASEAGNYWSKYGITGGLREAWSGFKLLFH